MNKGVKIGLITASVLGLGYLILKGTQTAGDANVLINNVQLAVKPSATRPIRVSGINTIIVSLDLQIFNPSKLTLTLEKPTITIKYGNSVLATSKGSSDLITLLPQNTTTVQNIKFEISILSNLATWIEIGQTIGKDTSSSTGISELCTQLAANASKVLSLLKCDLVTYWGNTPIQYSTTIV